MAFAIYHSTLAHSAKAGLIKLVNTMLGTRKISARDKLKRLVDSSPKRWMLAIVFVAFLLASNDYNVALLQVPEFDQLHHTEGTIKFRSLITQRNGHHLFKQRNRYDLPLRVKGSINPMMFKCGINAQDYRRCISEADPSFFESRENKKNKSGFIPIQGKQGQVWWFEGPLKEKKLMQLVVDGETVISYESSKQYYLEQQQGYWYFNTVALIISFSLFCFFQLSEPSDEYTKGKSETA